MSSDLMILKPDVVIEPLVSRWHAWSHLISPATAALNLQFRLLAQMESFVSDPALHELALKNPSLRGGPFVDLPVDRADQVKELVQITKTNRQDLISFGLALKEAFIQVMKHGDGSSLEPLYAQLPEAVRGYVELSYSLGGYPDLRIIESLLYLSPLYDANNQSAMIYRQAGDDRPFVFSTPRLSNPSAIDLNLPFKSPIYDFLASLRSVPQSPDFIIEKLGFSGSDKELFLSFLEPAPSLKNAPVQPEISGLRWRYFGHACVLIESPDGCNVLIDPVVAYDGANGIARFTIRDLPEKIDYVVLTHNHSDHVALETLLALRWKIGTIIVPTSGGSLADPSLKLMLKAIGFKQVVELGPMDSISHSDVEITAIPFLGEHGDLDIRSKAAWLVKIADKKLLFAADSNNLDPKLYDFIHRAVGSIDTLFIGMECQGAPMSWVYGPLLPMSLDRKKDQTRRLNGSDFPRAMKVVESLQCKKVFVYAMGMEPWMQYITSIDPSEDTPPMVNSTAFVKTLNEQGIPALRLYGQYELYEN